ncbi:hypothetical protein [Candidatus Stoquefichus massiliensis]|uniref:hypothetical protein n=1 Tax=Candidatus Stoquefichus massiliensis TaxID=1470350 RepID=UPI00047F9093|nr:hypothetical protein [Candidatus Stoquefichus massiliensis]
MNYRLKDCILVWDYDETITKACNLKLNNLYIDGIWNMKDTVGYSDTCVGFHMLSEDTYYFITFNGIGFLMKYINHKVECLQKQITK